ncbi:substrate-binding domain-containing protein [Tahibacter amnicola]|uniref:Substrate-binding domain-containing protein n=1 Tax=Tahibacter amnicola TaxID=2976241 RepID=A0ABY6BE03_9GAMM|nr:substrate-binding domain-containing protein [Tahibacter amnicola]UXI67989.1 substrate-binding domain-containing protein [Tahibacter amnicola]
MKTSQSFRGALARAFLPLAMSAGIFFHASAAAQTPPAAPTPAAPATKPATPAPAAAAKPAAAAPAARPAVKADAKPATAKAPAKATPAKVTLAWRGDHATARGVMTELARQYEREKKIRIEVTPFSTISGIDAAANGSADFAGSLRPAHGKRAEESGLTFVPIAWDGLVILTSPSNPVSNITLKDIWRVYYGRADNWKLLGGKDQPINAYAVTGPLDGVEYALRALLFKNGEQRVATPRLYLNTSKLEEGITLDPAGFGVSTLSNAAGNAKLKILQVEGVVPSTASVGDGSYPLYTPIYLALREDSAKAAEVKEFIAWLETPSAKATLRKRQLVPYADGLNLKDADATRVAMIETKVNETPVSAPIATAAALTRVAPTSPATQAAKERADQARDAKADGKVGN